jgi:hypothetical protein
MFNAFGAAPVMGPWQGGLAHPVGPPSRPQFGSGALTLVSQTDASSGSLVSYVGGIFTAQFWTTGHPVPFLVRELDAEDVKALRDELSEQLEGPSTGLDEVPLRAFVAAADAYVAARSGRFSGAALGPISRPAPGELLGELSWPSGTVGTVLASKQGVSGQSHIPPLPASDPVPLRGGELRSLISALSELQRGCSHGVDPLWSELRDLAHEDVTARDSRRFW